MSTATIRASLAAILDAVPEINSANAYPPDKIGALPCAFCGLNDRKIDYTASQEVNDHTLPVVVLVERTAGMLPQNLARVEVVEEAFMTKMRANVSLGDTVSLATVSRIQQDQIQIGQTPYIGFVATLNVRHKFGVTLTG